MLIKIARALFWGSLCSSMSIFAGVSDVAYRVIESFPLLQSQGIVNLIESIWTFNFYLLLVTLIVFGCSVAIQAYTLHRLLKVACTQAVPRMLVINIVQDVLFVFLLMVVGYCFSSEKMIWLGSMISPEIFHICHIVAYIVFTIAIFVVRVLVAGKIFSWFDPSLNKKNLQRAMIYANAFSAAFLLVYALVQNYENI